MTLDAWITLVVVTATVVALAREVATPAATMLGSVLVLLLAGVIDADQAFSGFSNEAPIIVGSLLVLAKAAERTGAFEAVMVRLLGQREGRSQLARLVVPTTLASAVLNNTTIVAVGAPAVVQWANRRGASPSQLLMPLSFAAVLGGVATTIGTSTNIVVSGLLTDAGLAPLGLFELTPAGLPIALAGAGMLVLVTPRLLKDRTPTDGQSTTSGREFSVAMTVVPDGPLPGSSVEEAGLRNLSGVYLVQIRSGDRVVAPVDPETVLQADDELVFVGRIRDVIDLQRQRGLASLEAREIAELATKERGFFETVVGAVSPLAGLTLKEAEFRTRYQAAVLAIHRAGQDIDAKLGDVRLRVGDTLLLLSDRGFAGRWRDQPDFLLVAPTAGDYPSEGRGHARVVAALAAGLILLTGFGVVDLLRASVAVAALVVVTGTLTLRQARRAVDIDLLALLAASFGLGAAVSTSGLADTAGAGLVELLRPLGTLAVLAGVLLATMALTEAIANGAAAVLMFPIGLAIARDLGANPRAFAVAVTFGASLSFLTPIGYQTNLMVYGLGGYHFTDFTRLGLPINLVAIVGSLLLIPVVWPLTG